MAKIKKEKHPEDMEEDWNWEQSRKGKDAGDESADKLNVSENRTKGLSYDEQLQHINTIARPVASKKVAKKLYKLIKKASKRKTFLYNGLKLVQSKIRKGDRGLVILAGNVTPIDIICHMPAVCEENKIPYIFTPSREELGTAMCVKRASLMVMIREHEDYKDLYKECIKEVMNAYAGT